MKKLVSFALENFVRKLKKRFVRLHILGNEHESSQNTSHDYMQNSFLFWCFREWISDG